jgi:hypothetical protein
VEDGDETGRERHLDAAGQADPGREPRHRDGEDGERGRDGHVERERARCSGVAYGIQPTGAGAPAAATRARSRPTTSGVRK